MRIIKKIIFMFLLLVAASTISIPCLAIFIGGLFLISKVSETGRTGLCFLLTLLTLMALACTKYIFVDIFYARLLKIK